MTGLVLQINQILCEALSLRDMAFLYIAKGDVIKKKIQLPLCGTLFFEETDFYYKFC